MMGIVPYAGVTFFTYETSKRWHHEYTGKSEPHPLERMAFGAIAGLLGQTASYPLDVIRRRMQTSATKLKFTDTANRVMSDPQGKWRSMFRGMSLNWIKGPISVGVSFTTFDLLSKFLKTVI